MPPRYRTALALTLALTASLPAAARAPGRRNAVHHHARVAGSVSISPDGLYSRRALRRARTILELKLLELRSERLERVRKALEKHIPIDELLKD